MIASKVVMFLPRNADINQLAELSLSLNPPWELEVHAVANLQYDFLCPFICMIVEELQMFSFAVTFLFEL